MTKTKVGVLAIVKGEMSGTGIVNTDSWETQKFEQKKYGRHVSLDNNVKPAKIVIDVKKNENGLLTPVNESTRAKISTGAMKNPIFADGNVPQSLIAHLAPEQQAIAQGSFCKVVQGHLTPVAGNTYKRKSPLTLSCAEQVGGTAVMREIITQEGARGATSMSFSDTAGKMLYEFTGAINLQEMQFISCDSVYDRPAFNEDLYDQYVRPSLEFATQSKAIPDLAYYAKKASVIKIPERGVLLSSEQVITLTRELLKRMLDLKIYRSSAMAQVDKLTVSAKGLGDFTLSNESDIDSFLSKIEVEPMYVKCENESDILNNTTVKKSLLDAKGKKDAAKEEKKDKKEKSIKEKAAKASGDKD